MSEHHHSSDWARARRIARPRLAASLPAPCVDCGRPVLRSQRWQVGHIVDAATARRMGWSVARINAQSNLGPSHTKSAGQKACNQIAGGRIGARTTNTRRRAQRTARTEYPGW